MRNRLPGKRFQPSSLFRSGASKQPLVGSEWNDRQQEFLKTLEELSMHRQKLQRNRVEVESQVVGQYFR